MNRQEAERVNIGDKIEVDGWEHSVIKYKKPVEVKAIVRGVLSQTGIMFTIEDTRRLLHTLAAGWFKQPSPVDDKTTKGERHEIQDSV